MTKQKICGIYCIENLVNHKKYIGQSIDVLDRLADHRTRLRGGYHPNAHLQSSWNTYGEENFNFYIVEECDITNLDIQEIYYIAEFNTQDDQFGYNVEPGGHAIKNMAEQTKQKISDTLTGRKFSEEHRKKIGEANHRREITDEMRSNMSKNHADVKGSKNPRFGKPVSEETRRKISENRTPLRGEYHPMYGKHPSDEVREKMRQSHIGLFDGPNHPKCRPVYCPELDESFWGAKEAEIKYNIPASYIAAVLRGRQKTAGKHPVTGVLLHWQDVESETIQN